MDLDLYQEECIHYFELLNNLGLHICLDPLISRDLKDKLSNQYLINL